MKLIVKSESGKQNCQVIAKQIESVLNDKNGIMRKLVTAYQNTIRLKVQL